MPHSPTPSVGAPAPAFSMAAVFPAGSPLSGGVVSPQTLAGRTTVLYFYPRDDTAGCTKEANEFTALIEDFAALGVVVVGVSKDSLESHEKFAAKHGLAVVLASDADGAACEAFGVWVEKSMYGRKYMGVERSTFLIAADGSIAQIWRKARPGGHAAAVLKAVKAHLA